MYRLSNLPSYPGLDRGRSEMLEYRATPGGECEMTLTFLSRVASADYRAVEVKRTELKN
jgi:hypothetical protein